MNNINDGKIIDYIMITIMIILLMVPVAFWSYGEGVETGKQVKCEKFEGEIND